MTLEELSDHTHNGQMNHALHSVAALFEADGWGPCDSIKAANELLKPAWDAWSTLMDRVTSDAVRIAQLETELAEARKNNDELDGTDAAHPAWWRGNDAGVAQVCAKINAIIDGADVFGTASEPWESTRRRVAEARKDSERLKWAWANPDKFTDAQRSTPPNRTGRQQIDAARGTK